MPILTPPPSVLAICATLRRHGHRALIAGGAVRDSLLGLAPKDYDIATDATPDRIEALFGKTVPIGRAFGVMAVVVDGTPHEVATFRADGGYADGRRPDTVTFSTPEADVQRRDFTVNALLYDPETDTVLDFVRGRADLDAKPLRTVGDPARRFAEDHLRPLRAVRFAARLGFAIEENPARALREHAARVADVAPERVAAELSAMLTGGHARTAFELLDRHALLPVVLPEVARLRGVAQPPQYHPEGDVWTHTMIMLGLLDAAARGDWARAVDPGGEVPPTPDLPDDAVQRGMTLGTEPPAWRADAVRETWAAFDADARLTLAWACLLHDVGKPDTQTFDDRIRFHDHDRLGADMAAGLLERLRRPRALIDGVRELIGRHIHFANLRRMRGAKRRRWLREADAPLHLELHRIDCASSHGMLANWEYAVRAWRAECAVPEAPPTLVDGKDLIALGWLPGPALGAALKAVRDAQWEGQVADRAQALDWLRAFRTADGEG